MRKFLAIAFLALSICPLFGQATSGFYRTNQVIARGTGVAAEVVPYATVTVTNTSTGTAATIYSDPLLTAQISPPVVHADASGNYAYYIALNVCVTETITSPGQGVKVVPNICGNTGGISIPVGIAAGGTNATTAPQALINLGALAAANNLSDVANETTARNNLGALSSTPPGSPNQVIANIGGVYAASGMTADSLGNMTAISVNAVANPKSFSGATADVQLNACFAAALTCDARSYGNTSQTIAALVTVPAGHTLLADPATSYQPSATSTNMFAFGERSTIKDLHIDTTNQATYSGAAISNAAGQAIDWAYLKNIYVKEASGSTGQCLNINATSASTQWVEFIAVDGFNCYAGTAASGILLQNSSTGYVNSNGFSHVRIYSAKYGIEIEQNGTGGITGNTFSDYGYEALSLSTALAAVYINAVGHNGGHDASDNIFQLIDWDQTVGNKAFIITSGSNGFACGNQFVGQLWPFTDNSSSCAGFSGTDVKDLSAQSGFYALTPVIQAIDFMQSPYFNATGSNGYQITNGATTATAVVGDGTNTYLKAQTTGGSVFVQTGSGPLSYRFDNAGEFWIPGSAATLALNSFGVLGLSGADTVLGAASTGKVVLQSNNASKSAQFDASGNFNIPTGGQYEINGIPMFVVNTCGTTTTCSNTPQSNPRTVWGTVALSGGTAVVGSMTAWTSTTSFSCVGTDTISAVAVKIANTSTSSITITGTGTDVIAYHCVGN